MSKAVLLCAVFICAVCSCEGYQLTLSPNSTCLARGNGTCVDLSSMFDWPVKFKVHPGPDANPSTYLYWYNPCNPVKCDTNWPSTNVAVCQQSDTLYNAGELSPIWLWNGVYPGNSVGDLARANMTILYPGGDTWRNTVVTFLEDPTLEHPTIEMTGEDPYLQYNFVIKSKELGFRHVEFPCWE